MGVDFEDQRLGTFPVYDQRFVDFRQSAIRKLHVHDAAARRGNKTGYSGCTVHDDTLAIGARRSLPRINFTAARRHRRTMGDE